MWWCCGGETDHLLCVYLLWQLTSRRTASRDPSELWANRGGFDWEPRGSSTGGQPEQHCSCPLSCLVSLTSSFHHYLCHIPPWPLSKILNFLPSSQFLLLIIKKSQRKLNKVRRSFLQLCHRLLVAVNFSAMSPKLNERLVLQPCLCGPICWPCRPDAEMTLTLANSLLHHSFRGGSTNSDFRKVPVFSSTPVDWIRRPVKEQIHLDFQNQSHPQGHT